MSIKFEWNGRKCSFLHFMLLFSLKREAKRKLKFMEKCSQNISQHFNKSGKTVLPSSSCEHGTIKYTRLMNKTSLSYYCYSLAQPEHWRTLSVNIVNVQVFEHKSVFTKFQLKIDTISKFMKRKIIFDLCSAMISTATKLMYLLLDHTDDRI